MRDYMDKWATSPPWGPPPPCKQELNLSLRTAGVTSEWKNKLKQCQTIAYKLWNRLKIIGLFPCYVLLARTWNVVSVLYLTIMSNNSSVLSSMAFFQIAPALHSSYLFLMPSVKTWTKILKQKLLTWMLLIPLITKLYFKRSNDMVQKAARFFGLHIT